MIRRARRDGREARGNEEREKKEDEKGSHCRGVARIFLKGVFNLVSLTSPFLQTIGCIVLALLATLSAFSLET